TNNSIQSVKRTLVADTISTTYKNTGKQNVFGLDINSTVNVSKKLSFTVDINTFYTIIKGGDISLSGGIRNEGMSYFASLLGRYKVSPKVRLEVNGFNFGNTYFLQGYQQVWSIFNVSV